ncbi:hypothetical protein MAR_015102 [Mya arenaria]|uniref:Uncharacterized protein n=1 Tax=Mya arenaria TaxID=6604 RepID=A0ABY7FKC5_MYAAR|nr:hypothetical protein MAR_015102 [Mya arenaria]
MNLPTSNSLIVIVSTGQASITLKHKSLSAFDKLLITLRYLATGGMQLNDADMHNVSQPAVSKILTEVTNHLSSADVLGRWWVSDGTHIRIQVPSDEGPSFDNMKGFIMQL